MKKIYLVYAATFLIVFAQSQLSAETIKSSYFNITLDDSIDRNKLMKRLEARYFLKKSAVNPGEKQVLATNFGDQFARVMDTIYLQVCDTIDVHMSDFVVNLCIVPDKEALSEMLESSAGRNVNAPSFYYSDKNTIYISFKDLNSGMLAHEISHAIIMRYFAVPPPEKIQEIIAGYCEYSVKKHLMR